MMNKRGFTLMELLVYMAIVGVIVIVAGQAFSDSTKMRIRTQSMIQANQVAENVGALIKSDISQMGAKSAYDSVLSTPTRDVFPFKDSVFMVIDGAAPDSSSFSWTKRDEGDSIAFRRLNYSETGSYVRVEQVSWYKKENVLYRSCMTVSGTEDTENCPKDTPNEVEIATNVDSFALQPATPGVVGDDGLLFPRHEGDLSNRNFKLASRFGVDNFVRIVSSPESGATSVVLTGFLTNYREDGSDVSDAVGHQVYALLSGTSSNSWETCEAMTFKKDSTYEISFEMVNSDDEARMFIPEKDLFSVGLRMIDAGVPSKVAGVPDFHFYPPENDDGVAKRVMRFSPRDSISACLAFSFSFFSPTASMGQIAISNLQVNKVSEANYSFVDGYDPAIEDKKKVRAFKLHLIVKTNGESGNAELVIPVPSNGVEG